MRIWIAADSGTWGNAENIVIVDIADVSRLDTMTDSEIMALADGPKGAVHVPFKTVGA